MEAEESQGGEDGEGNSEPVCDAEAMFFRQHFLPQHPHDGEIEPADQLEHLQADEHLETVEDRASGLSNVRSHQEDNAPSSADQNQHSRHGVADLRYEVIAHNATKEETHHERGEGNAEGDVAVNVQGRCPYEHKNKQHALE